MPKLSIRPEETPVGSAIDAVRGGYDVRKLTIAEVLSTQARMHPEKLFLRYLPDGRCFSYFQMAELTSRFARGLQSIGVNSATHVCVMLENSPELLVCHFAIGVLAAVTVPINIAARGQMLRHLLLNSEASVLVLEADLLERYLELADDLPRIRQLVIVGGVEGDIVSATSIRFESLLTRGYFELSESPATFQSLAYILYTSGTTGHSKGVMLTQARSLLWGIGHAEVYGHRADDVFYICLPLFHVNALQGSVYLALTLGASVALQRRFSASGFWSDIRANGATISNLLGSMVNILWSRPATVLDQSGIRMCLCAPVPAFAEEFQRRFGLRFIAAFSLTDFGASHALPLNSPPEKLRSCGRLRPGFECRIVDADDFPVSVGEAGELTLRTTLPWNVSSGYYGNPEATVLANRNGWFHTGDRARVDEDGYLWFVDRQKDVIRRRGENISAKEVEEVIASHPAVEDAAVFPIASEMSEDEVAAAVVRVTDMALSELDLIEFCARNMPHYMVPRFVSILSDLPRNSSQKIDKVKLRSEAEAARRLYWDREAAGVVLAR